MFNYLLSVDRFFNNVYKFINVKFDFFLFNKRMKKKVIYIFENFKWYFYWENRNLFKIF